MSRTDPLKWFIEHVTMSQALQWLVSLAEMKLVVLVVVVGFWVISVPHFSAHPHPILQTL